MLKALVLDTFFPVNFGHKSASRVLVKQAKSKSKDAFWFYSNVAVIAVSAVMLLSYLFGVNNYASKGFEIKSLQSRISQLTEENKKLSVKVSEQTSMTAIQNDFLSSNFVPAGQAKFLQVNQYSQR